MAHLAARTAKRQRVPWNSVAGPRWCWTQRVETFPVGAIGLQFWKFLGLFFFGKLRPIPGKTKILDEIMMCFYVFFPKKLDIWWTRNVHILSHVMSGWPTKTVTQKEFLRRISGEEQSHHQPGGARAPPSEMAVNIAEQGAVGWIMFLYVVVFFFF